MNDKEQRFDAFMRRVGEKHPELHPDFDREDPTWQMPRREGS